MFFFLPLFAILRFEGFLPPTVTTSFLTIQTFLYKNDILLNLHEKDITLWPMRIKKLGGGGGSSYSTTLGNWVKKQDIFEVLWEKLIHGLLTHPTFILGVVILEKNKKKVPANDGGKNHEVEIFKFFSELLPSYPNSPTWWVIAASHWKHIPILLQSDRQQNCHIIGRFFTPRSVDYRQ